MSKTLRTLLPAVYGSMLPDVFDRPEIEEPRATCDDCAMCDKGAAPPELRAAFFKPDLKCCTYHPTLPNYLVGAVLSDPRPELEEGRRRLRAKLAKRIGITPEWVAAPRKYRVLLDAARETSFGRSEALLCPYFEREGGRCTIWQNRESVCATFFCKHVGGGTAKAFWTALADYLRYTEVSLAQHAVRALATGAREPQIGRFRLTPEDLVDQPPSDADYASYWGDWLGREESFYVAAHACIRDLSKADFEREVHDARGLELLALLVARYEALASPKLAENLVLNRAMRVLPVPGGVTVTTYSRYDSLFLTTDLYDALKLLKPGETPHEALARLQREHDLELPEELLLQMQMHEIVAPAAEAATDGSEPGK